MPGLNEVSCFLFHRSLQTRCRTERRVSLLSLSVFISSHLDCGDQLLIHLEWTLTEVQSVCWCAEMGSYLDFVICYSDKCVFFVVFYNLYPWARHQFASTPYTLGQWLFSTWRGGQELDTQEDPCYILMVDGEKWTFQCSNMLKNRSISCMFALRAQSTLLYKCL